MLGQNAVPAIFDVTTYTSYSSSDYNGFRQNPDAASSFRWNVPAAADRVGDLNGAALQRRELATQSAEVGLLQAWRATGAGLGLSSFSSAGGRLYTLGDRGNTGYIIAFDKLTGAVLWRSQDGQAAHSSAVLAAVGGVRQAIFFSDRRTWGIDIRDGSLL